jgi:hypothetical protein
MNAHARDASPIWATLLRALTGCHPMRVADQSRCSKIRSNPCSLQEPVRWVDTVRLSAPR